MLLTPTGTWGKQVLSRTWKVPRPGGSALESPAPESPSDPLYPAGRRRVRGRYGYRCKGSTLA